MTATDPLRGVGTDQRRRVRQLLEDGWQLERTGNGHLKLTHPNGGFVITSPRAADVIAARHHFERNIRQVQKGQPTT